MSTCQDTGTSENLHSTLQLQFNTRQTQTTSQELQIITENSTGCITPTLCSHTVDLCKPEQTGSTVSRSIACKCRGMADIVNYLSNIHVPLLPNFAGRGWVGGILSFSHGHVMWCWPWKYKVTDILFPGIYFLAYFFSFLHSFLLPGTKKQSNLAQKETIFSVKTSAKEKGVRRHSGTV